MEPKDKLQETIRRIAKEIPVKEKSQQIRWIINRYIYYMFEAVLNGYPIVIRKRIRMSLEFLPVRRIYSRTKRIYILSNRLFDYMFYVSMKCKYQYNKYYIFVPSNNLKERVRERINTDAVYKLVKR